MKRIATVLSVIAVSTLFSAITVIAADNAPDPYGEEYGSSLLSLPTRNECLLVAKNCATESSTVQERVNDLRREIAKGRDVYTPNELKALEEQLKWIETESSNVIM